MPLPTQTIGNPLAKFGRLQPFFWMAILFYFIAVGYFCAFSPKKAIALVALPVGGFFLIKFPRLPVYLFLITVAGEGSFNLVPGFVSIGKPLGLLVVGVFVLHLVISKLPLTILPIHRSLFAFTLLCAISSLWSVAPSATAIGVLKSVQLIVFFIIVYNLFDSQKAMAGLTHAFCIGASIPSAIMPFFVRETFFYVSREAGFEQSNQNTIALAIVIAFFLALLRFPRAKGIERVILISYLPLFLTGIILTQSRSAALSLVVGLVLITLRHATMKNIKYMILIGTFLTLFVAGVSNFLPVERIIRQRLVYQTLESSNPTSNRLAIWKTARYSFSKRPLLGSGFNAYQFTHSKDTAELLSGHKVGENVDAHNTFIRILGELGLVGFIWACAIIVSLFKTWSTLPSNYDKTMTLALAFSAFVNGFFHSFYHNKSIWLVGTVILILAALSQKTNSDSNSEAVYRNKSLA